MAPFLQIYQNCKNYIVSSLGNFQKSARKKYAMVEATKGSYDDVVGADFIVKSPGPNFEAVTGFTIPEFIWENVHSKENEPALECAVTGRILTHGDIHRQGQSFGAALIKAGLKRKDIVGVLLPNMPEYAVIVFGIWEAGGTVSSTNPAYTAEEIERQVTISDAKFFITSAEYLHIVLTVKEVCPQLKTIILLGEPQEGCICFDEMLKESTIGVEFLKGSEIDTQNEIASLPFSSGTTGPPKGVELTHSNLCSNLVQCCLPDFLFDNHPAERLILILPSFHAYGLIQMLLNLYKGYHMLSIPKFSPTTFIKYIRKFKPTTMALVPPLVAFMANSAELTAQDLASVDCIEVSAAPLGTTIIERLLKKAEKFIFFQEMYGLTETAPCVMAVTHSIGNAKLGSCGPLIPGTFGKVIDMNTGESLGPRIRGEVCLKGAQLMRGYFRNEEATKAVIDSEGWFHTGDIGYYDEDGCFYIVDRLKEIIKVNAFQVAPAELEDELRKLPEVVDVAVIGVPNERTGELPRAYIVRNSENLTEDGVNQYLNGKVAKYKQLKGGIEFVAAIPKAASGKILRRELKADYLAKYESANHTSRVDH